MKKEMEEFYKSQEVNSLKLLMFFKICILNFQMIHAQNRTEFERKMEEKDEQLQTLEKIVGQKLSIVIIRTRTELD